MTLPKFLVVLALVLFTTVGIMAVVKKIKKKPSTQEVINGKKGIEIDLSKDLPPETTRKTAKTEPAKESLKALTKADAEKNKSVKPLPHADRIEELFNKGEPKLPIVETITYRSRVSWQKGRPAWLSDYATYFATSRHFISRSLLGKPEYFKKDIAEGDRFNVLKKDKNIQFYLLIDVSRCRLWFYYLDLDTNQRVFLKDYIVGLGRIDSGQGSGSLTPLGKYSLGDRIAIYKPKMTGFHKGQKVEMIQVFGTRWIPFDKEISDTTAPSKGFGIHGVPWQANGKGELVEDLSSLGKNLSDGCVRLSTKDMEELFSIIITRPTMVELVKDFYQAKAPGIEK